MTMRHLVWLCLVLTACTYRNVSISSDPSGATAYLTDKPRYRVGTPGSLRLPARHSYQIEIEKDGYEPGFVNVPANSDWWLFWPINQILTSQGRYDTAYAVKLEVKQPIAAASWENPSNGFERCSDAYLRDFGTDVSTCRTKAYVGNEAHGKGESGAVFGRPGRAAAGIASSSSELNSQPSFDHALFVACMMGEGWHKVVIVPPATTCTSEIQ